ncbi:unnamed protein product [Thelazia callipaeda]|uniref:Rhodanese domain-containing protein n=1 Tax=Thelazia callipaeda TaxID=103827 RepID=A0A0N5CKJ8_THECL|nr:unnamed protein product [Thelazia callipaeda]
MKLKNFIKTSVVAEILKTGGFTKGGGFRLLDCASVVSPRDHKEFMESNYGKFEKLMSMNTSQRQEYMNKHIPNAVHIDLNIATYPDQYQPYSMYPPEIFQKYARLLGINRSEHIILYDRERVGGMLHPCRISWLFKYYGHKAVSVMDGGLQAWEEDGGEVTQKEPKIEPGDWVATLCPEYIVTYEDLVKKDASGRNLLDKAAQLNFFDSRPREQFEGKADTGLDPNKVTGSHVKGMKCAPAVEMIDENGRLKTDKELKFWLQKCGFKHNLPTISLCLRGMQACMLNLVIEDIFPTLHPRVYHGSCLELQNRDPARLSE